MAVTCWFDHAAAPSVINPGIERGLLPHQQEIIGTGFADAWFDEGLLISGPPLETFQCGISQLEILGELSPVSIPADDGPEGAESDELGTQIFLFPELSDECRQRRLPIRLGRWSGGFNSDRPRAERNHHGDQTEDQHVPF